MVPRVENATRSLVGIRPFAVSSGHVCVSKIDMGAIHLRSSSPSADTPITMRIANCGVLWLSNDTYAVQASYHRAIRGRKEPWLHMTYQPFPWPMMKYQNSPVNEEYIEGTGLMPYHAVRISGPLIKRCISTWYDKQFG